MNQPLVNGDMRRELWQPDRHEQMAACEILLAATIPYELRVLVRELEFKLATERRPT